jgi:hypothetical protein
MYLDIFNLPIFLAKEIQRFGSCLCLRNQVKYGFKLIDARGTLGINFLLRGTRIRIEN